ncbi:YARHG domain-containing protein [Fibrobacter intestinalis]|uniref:YARHG domain-containing protein n=1 Tax=Fibrobacter sp. NR9 TaxID=1896200 RepID=UPI00099A69FA
MYRVLILRNSIFARHGYIFKSEDLKAYFSKFNWYIGFSRFLSKTYLNKSSSMTSLLTRLEVFAFKMP